MTSKYNSNDTFDFGPFKGLSVKRVDYDKKMYVFYPITINDLQLSIEDVDKNATNAKLTLQTNGGMRRSKTRRSKTLRRKTLRNKIKHTKKSRSKSYRVVR